MKKYIFPEIGDSNKILYLDEEQFKKYEEEHGYPDVYPHGIIEYNDIWVEAKWLDQIFDNREIKDFFEFMDKKNNLLWRIDRCKLKEN